MKNPNYCHTYFRVKGDFDPNELTKLLGIEPFSSWSKDDIRRDGKPYGFNSWGGCYIDEYDPYVSNMMEKSIAPLLDKIDILNEFRNKHDVEYYLEIVPHIYVNTVNPCLSPSLKVIEFCHLTKTQPDIDMYIYPEE